MNSPETPEARSGPKPPALGAIRPTGGAAVTLEQKQHIFERRERAVELRARGYSYEQIARATKVDWKTAYADVQLHLANAARYWSAARKREEIAEIYRTAIRRADEIYLKLTKNAETAGDTLESLEARGKQLALMQKSADGLTRLYGFGGDRAIVLGDIGATVTEGAFGDSREWARDKDPEQLEEIRRTVITLYKKIHPASVPAHYQLETDDETIESSPAIAAERPSGPLKMTGG